MNLGLILIIAVIILALIGILFYVFRKKIKEITLFKESDIEKIDAGGKKSIFQASNYKPVFSKIQDSSKMTEEEKENMKKSLLTQKKSEAKQQSNPIQKKPYQENPKDINPPSETGKIKKTGIETDIKPKNIKLKDESDIFLYLKNKEVIDVLRYLESKKIIFLKNYNYEKIFKDEKEIEEYLKSSLITYLNDNYEDLKVKISDLRRKGKDVQQLSLNLMSIPLKIKIFKASFSQKDLDVVLNRLEEIKDKLKKIS
jgi:hypothetical protein